MNKNSTSKKETASAINRRSVLPQGTSGSQVGNATGLFRPNVQIAGVRTATPADENNRNVVKVISKSDLLAIRRYERRVSRRFNRAPSDYFLKIMPKDRLLPIHDTMIHTDYDSEMRCFAFSPEFDGEVVVDMPFEIYDRLARVDLESRVEIKGVQAA